MGRPHRTREQRGELVHAVTVARANRVPWKVIENVYGVGRMQLWRYLRETAANDTTNSEMIHLRGFTADS